MGGDWDCEFLSAMEGMGQPTMWFARDWGRGTPVGASRVLEQSVPLPRRAASLLAHANGWRSMEGESIVMERWSALGVVTYLFFVKLVAVWPGSSGLNWGTHTHLILACCARGHAFFHYITLPHND